MKRLKIFLTFFILLIIWSLMLSCSSTSAWTDTAKSSQNVTETLPLAFQGMLTGGTAGNPNAEIKLDTILPVGVSHIMVYQITKIGIVEASAIAKTFGLENYPVPFNPSSPNAERKVYSYTDNSKTLEVYPIGRFILRDSQTSTTSPATLPTKEECTGIAEMYLKSKQMYPDNVSRITTEATSAVSLTDIGSGQSPVFQPTSFTASFFSATNGYERYSAGARVTLGERGKIIQLTVCNPTLKEYGISALKTPAMALNILQLYVTNPSINPPEAKECSVNWNGFQKLSIKKVSLQYRSTDQSEYLLPIYVFEGEVQESLSNPQTEKFMGLVDAVDHQKP